MNYMEDVSDTIFNLCVHVYCIIHIMSTECKLFV